MKSTLYLTVVSGSLALTAPVQAQPRHWVPSGTVAGADGVVDRSCVYDPDGEGPQPPMLVLAGAFGGVSGAIGRVVAHDANGWRAITDGLIQPMALSTDVNVLLQFDPDGDGPGQPQLIMGGGQNTGVPGCTRIAAWDGQTWSPLGSGPGGWIFHACVHDFDGDGPQPAKLVVAGEFLFAGGVVAEKIAAWDGASWSAVGSRPGSGPIASVDTDGAGPLPPRLVSWPNFGAFAEWDGTDWVERPAFHGNPNKGIAWDPDGDGPAAEKFVVMYPSAGTNSNAVATWDGNSWTFLPGVTGYRLNNLGTFDPDGPGPALNNLVVTGSFSSVNGQQARGIAQWDGSNWSAFGAGLSGRLYDAFQALSVETLSTYDMHPDDDQPYELVAAGVFAASGSRRTLGVASWNGESWIAPDGTTDGPIHDVTMFDFDGEGPMPAEVVAAGNFTRLEGAEVRNIAVWRNNTWEQLGEATNGIVRGLEVFDPDGSGPEPASLYAAGEFSRVGGEFVGYIVRWDVNQWVPVDGGTSAPIYAMLSYDADGDGPGLSELYVAGYFSGAGPVTAQGIAAWNGATWSEVGTSNILEVYALAQYDADGDGPLSPRLIAGATTFGPGLPNHGILQWDGQSWSTMAGGFSDPPTRAAGIIAFDPDGPGPENPLLWCRPIIDATTAYLWNGSSWSAAPGGIGRFAREGLFNPSRSGDGYPRLFIETLEGVFVYENGGWVNTGVEPVGAAPETFDYVTFLGPVDLDGPGGRPPALWLSGYFSSINGEAAGFLAKWEVTCQADLDGSGGVDVPDIFAYLGLWFAGNLEADIDGTPGLAVPDIFAFLSLWFAGCP